MRGRFMVGAGRFFFRYRAWMFPILFIGMAYYVRPRVVVNETVSDILVWLGFAIALLGEGIRMFNVGFDYIERGGKEGKVYASRLVTGGLYKHVRNPMYLGNLLMALGVGLYASAPILLVTALPFFVFFYYAIMANEESFLRAKFGGEYDAFCARVNRLCPRLSGLSETLSGFSFNWRRVVEKENGTAFWTFVALALLPWWRLHFLGRFDASAAYAPYAIAIVAVMFPIYVAIRVMKRNGRLFRSHSAHGESVSPAR